MFGTGFNCLAQYVQHLRDSLTNFDLRGCGPISFPTEEEINAFEQTLVEESESTEDSSAKEVQSQIIPSCSLMEYEACISDQGSPLEVIHYLKDISAQLNKKIGGAVCPSSPEIRPHPTTPRTWIVGVKWALPMDNFAQPDAPDPDDLAIWIVSCLPPANPAAMSSSKGVFVDLDMSFFHNLTREAIRFHTQ